MKNTFVMDFFNYDLFSYIISFLDKSEHVLLREINIDTKNVMDEIYRNNKYIFPKKNLIYSSKKYISWAMQHNYTNINLKKFFRYNKNYDLDLIDYIYDNIYLDKEFHIKSFLRCMMYRSIYNNKQIISVFEWLVKKLGANIFFTEDLFLHCVFYNNLTILEFLKKSNCPFNKKHMQIIMLTLVSDYNVTPEYLQWINKNLVDI